MKIIIPDNSSESCLLLFSKRGDGPFTVHCYEIIPDEPGAPDAKPAPPEPGLPNGNGAHDCPVPRPPDALRKLRFFMSAKGISEESMLDWLKEEGRIAGSVTRLSEVPGPVIEEVVVTWMEMTEELSE